MNFADILTAGKGISDKEHITMNRLIILLLTLSLFWARNVEGQTTSNKAAAKLSAAAKVDDLFDDGLSEPDKEVEAALVFLQGVPAEDQEYIRFFTTYAIRPEKRDQSVLALSFVIHSLIGISDVNGGGGGYYPLAINEADGKDVLLKLRNLRLVKDTKTLWWIDLRECNWTPQAWEEISQLDGYFVSPVIDYDKYGLLKLLSGNAVVRADWFILHATDMSQQQDTERKTFIYDTLLYAQTKIPKNIDDFRKIWGMDIPQAERLGADYATLITKSQVVSRSGTRILFGYRTPLGYYYDTYDVKNIEGKRDYAENLITQRGKPPIVSDGGETFASNQLRLQVYALRDQIGKLVPVADAAIVRHTTDVLGDNRVITGRSCMDCHAAGPIPAENTLLEYIKQNNTLYNKNKQDQLRIASVYLSKKFEDAIVDDQELFAKAIKKVNGCTPEQNSKFYLDAITDYAQPVDLAQAAYECGLTVEEFRSKVSKIRSLRVLKMISPNSEPIPRQAWESPGKDGQPGLFQQCMIQIKGLTAKITETRVIDKRLTKDYVIIKKDTQVRITDPDTKKEVILGEVKVGDKLELQTLKYQGWVGVIFNGKSGYVEETNVTRE